MNALHHLAQWTANASSTDFSDQWQKATQWAMIAFVDTMGCMIGGSDHPATQQCYDMVSQWGSSPVTAIGYPLPMALPAMH